MKRKIIAGLLLIAMLTSLCSCGESKTGIALKDIASTGEAVKLSVALNDNSYSMLALSNTVDTEDNRIELDQMTTYPEIRKTMDDVLGIAKFASNSKNGCIYVSGDGAWTGNSTLFNAFKNKVFVYDYWEKVLKQSDTISKISKACEADYGVNIGNSTYELLLAIDSYYGIFNSGSDKNGGMLDVPVSRKDAMSALYKADTPVDLLVENKYSDFAENSCALYASQVEDCCYLNSGDGSLNAYSYYEPITKAEVIYMLVNRYYPEEYNNASLDKAYEGVANRGDLFDTFGVEKGTYWKMQSLEACLQNPEDGLTEDLLKALKVAKEHGMIGRIENWYESYTRYDFLMTLTQTYKNMFTEATFPVTANMGEQHVNTEIEFGKPNKDETELGEISVEKVEDAVELDSLLTVYKQEVDMTPEEIEKLIECSNEYSDSNPKGYHYELIDEYKTIKNTGDYGHLNFRYGPSTAYDIIQRIPEGTEVHIIAKCNETGWYRVIANKKVGYQCYAYLYNE